MDISKEQIDAITKPWDLNGEPKQSFEDAIKEGWAKATKYAGQVKPQYIVANAEVTKKYAEILNKSMPPVTDEQIEETLFSTKPQVEALIKSKIAYAEAHWPHFKELEPLITDILKQWPHATLEKAYQKALQIVEEKNHKLYWTPVIESEWSKPNELPDIAKLTFKQKQFFDSNQNLTLKFKPGYWSDKVPTPQPAAPQPTAPHPMPMWNMTDTIPLLKKLQPESRKFGYHVCVGGGVLNTWSSTKDLDLYYLPLNNEGETRPKDLIHHLAQAWGKPEPIGKSADYPHDALPYIAKLKFEFSKQEGGIKKRIDLFILGNEVFDVNECLESLSVKMPVAFLAKIIHRKRSKK